MTTERDRILADVRAGMSSHGAAMDPAAIAAEALGLLAARETIRPALLHADVIEAFIARATSAKVAATADRIPAIEELPDAVARYLASKGLPIEISRLPQPALDSLDWSAAGLDADTPLPTDGGTLVGLARCGIAETGTLVLHSAPDTPILPNFLALTQIFAVEARTILAYLEDYAERERVDASSTPRNACLITGASGTSDIEGAFVRGAHGPRHLHIVVCG